MEKGNIQQNSQQHLTAKAQVFPQTQSEQNFRYWEAVRLVEKALLSWLAGLEIRTWTNGRGSGQTSPTC